MKKVELKNLIKNVMLREYGFAPNSNQIKIIFTTSSGGEVLFTISGVEYSMHAGKVTKL